MAVRVPGLNVTGALRVAPLEVRRSVRLMPLIVAGSIASLNVTVIGPAAESKLAPVAGDVEITVGGPLSFGAVLSWQLLTVAAAAARITMKARWEPPEGIRLFYAFVMPGTNVYVQNQPYASKHHRFGKSTHWSADWADYGRIGADLLRWAIRLIARRPNSHFLFLSDPPKSARNPRQSADQSVDFTKASRAEVAIEGQPGS